VPEAGIDSVDGVPATKHLFDHFSGPDHAGLGLGCKLHRTTCTGDIVDVLKRKGATVEQ